MHKVKRNVLSEPGHLESIGTRP